MKRVLWMPVHRGLAIQLTLLALLTFSFCQKDESPTPTTPTTPTKYTMSQTLSDQAQQNTIAFDALGFMVGDIGGQTFLPPGKVADYSGFQYLRDNDPTELGHNTSFVTIIALNILNILNQDQLQLFIDAANDQIVLINDYAYRRFPLCKAFRRLLENNLPPGTTQLDEQAVKDWSAELYRLDGEISYNRAQLFGQVIRSMSAQQLAQLNALKALNGIGHWNSGLSDPLKPLKLQQDVNVGVMTYASEMYAWWAGSVEADVYFCPERQGTYFGSFYLKDWPAMGNPNYTINEQLTASAGQDFLKILTADQSKLITGAVDAQKASLLALVDAREDIATTLRGFLSGSNVEKDKVLTRSGDYGAYDGAIIYQYATRFSQVYQSLSASQKDQIKTMANQLGYITPPGAFLYSKPIDMPVIQNTDFFFR